MIRVGMSFIGAGDSYGNYPRALEGSAATMGLRVEPVWMLRHGAANADLSDIDGLLLTGGADVDPARYGRPEAAALCGKIDPRRDALEFELLEAALIREIPILAICRGLQLLNVHAGGTLIPHLDGHRRVDGREDATHDVEIKAGSLLARTAADARSATNSSHHQAADRVAPSFEVTATAADGTIEALERQEPAGRPYLLAVQWHPERMPIDHPLGGGILKSFLAACRR